jgi:hypothetical protein
LRSRFNPSTSSPQHRHSRPGRATNFSPAARRITAQRHDVADAGIPVAARDRRRFLARGIDAGQVRGGLMPVSRFDAFDGGVRAFARRTAGTVGHRDKATG